MSSPPESLDLMMQAWNETDLSRVRPILEHALDPSIVFIDPSIVTRGLDEFEANVRQFRTKYPTAVVRKSSGIDSHHHLHRYHWEILAGSRVFLQGFDVSETNEQGRVVRVVGFFGPMPPLAG